MINSLSNEKQQFFNNITKYHERYCLRNNINMSLEDFGKHMLKKYLDNELFYQWICLALFSDCTSMVECMNNIDFSGYETRKTVDEEVLKGYNGFTKNYLFDELDGSVSKNAKGYLKRENYSEMYELLIMGVWEAWESEIEECDKLEYFEKLGYDVELLKTLEDDVTQLHNYLYSLERMLDNTLKIDIRIEQFEKVFNSNVGCIFDETVKKKFVWCKEKCNREELEDFVLDVLGEVKVTRCLESLRNDFKIVGNRIKLSNAEKYRSYGIKEEWLLET